MYFSDKLIVGHLQGVKTIINTMIKPNAIHNNSHATNTTFVIVREMIELFNHFWRCTLYFYCRILL